MPAHNIRYNTRHNRRSLPEEAALALLTEREQEVLSLLALGRRNKQIAEQLAISASTVKSHVAHILTKLGKSSRMEAALFWKDVLNNTALPGPELDL